MLPPLRQVPPEASAVAHSGEAESFPLGQAAHDQRSPCAASSPSSWGDPDACWGGEALGGGPDPRSIESGD